MRYIFMIFFSIFFLVGCSYKHSDLYVGIKKTTEQGVANTKKAEIFKDGKIIIFATITYLNSLQDKQIVDKNLEQFVLGIHYVNFGTGEVKKDLKTKDILFKIDGKAGVSVKKLDPKSPILDVIPASNPWSQYFLVQTPKIDKNLVKFSFEIYPYKEISLNFEKDY